jgi:hypothetical protein
MTSQHRSDILTACGLMCWGIFTDSQSSRSNILYRVLAEGCGWRTQFSSRCRWHCSRRGSACAAATQGALPAKKPCVHMWPCMQAPNRGSPMCECWEHQMSNRPEWSVNCLVRSTCSSVACARALQLSCACAVGRLQGVTMLCGLGPLWAEHTAAGGHSSVAHRRHAGLRVVGPQRPALCARPQGCAPRFSSCTLLSGSTSVMPNAVICFFVWCVCLRL